MGCLGGLLRRIAGTLLGMSGAERITQLERRTEQLAEGTRLLRELHDSVGHALSVVTVQPGAARRTLRGDPGFTEQALTAIEESARTALEDLDHVLGLLRRADVRVRYAGKVPVTVAVSIAPGELCVKVLNPLGTARASRPRGGRGLRGMAERAELLRGKLSAGPAGSTPSRTSPSSARRPTARRCRAWCRGCALTWC